MVHLDSRRLQPPNELIRRAFAPYGIE